MTEISYLDASAIVKLVIDEADSSTMLRWYLESEHVVTSRIGLIETQRAVSRRDHDPAHMALVLDRIAVFELDADIGRWAAGLTPRTLRTLDAIHVASALAIDGLARFVTYDDRLAEAARSVGLPVVRPA